MAINRDGVDVRPRIIASGKVDGCPPGFYELNLAMERLGQQSDGSLFKYAYTGDILKDFDINKAIFVRVTKTLIECVILNGVREWELKVLAYMLNHVVGPLLLNTPTGSDNSKLQHIYNVTNDSGSQEIFKSMVRHIDPNSYPVHFVLYAKFHVEGSSLMHQIISNHTIKRLLRAYKKRPRKLVAEYEI